MRVEGMKLTLREIQSMKQRPEKIRAKDYLIDSLENEAFEFRATAASPRIIRYSRRRFPGLAKALVRTSMHRHYFPPLV